MRWSWKIGEVKGIGLYVHATFFLILLWVGGLYLAEGAPLAAALAGVFFILTLFVCVVLHEFGHALMARRFGIQTKDITLLPIGGIARLERMPEKPQEELLVALAGPAVTFAITAILFVWLFLTKGLAPFNQATVVKGPFLVRLMLVNAFLLLFNLLPAFPMDGGRVLRAFLATRMDYVRATRIAAHIGQGLAVIFGIVGFFANPFLILIALFVWIGASQESGLIQVKSALSGIPVRQAMLTDFKTLSAGDAIRHATDLILAGSQVDFPVMDNGKVVGILTREDLLRALAQKAEAEPIKSYMRVRFETLNPAETLDSAFARFQQCECRTMAVVENGKLVGLLTMENLSEFMMIESARKTGR